MRNNKNTNRIEVRIMIRVENLSYGFPDKELYKEVSFERGRNYISSLKEIFFENEFFSWHYKKVNALTL